MKQFRSLIMILIGMISFTALATTTALEQKQKPVLQVEFAQTVDAAVVLDLNTFQVFILNEQMSSQSFVKNANPNPNDLAIVADVGLFLVDQNKKIEIDAIDAVIVHNKEKPSDELRGRAQIKCIEGRSLTSTQNSYWHACVSVGGTTYFVALTYNSSGALLHNMVIAFDNCSCSDSC